MVGGRTSGASVLGDTWHGDKAKCRRCVPKRALLPRLSGQFAGNTDLIKIDEGYCTGRQEGEDGDWVDRRAGRNKFEFTKDLMERDSEDQLCSISVCVLIRICLSDHLPFLHNLQVILFP
jgi:hypothetical protein